MAYLPYKLRRRFPFPPVFGSFIGFASLLAFVVTQVLPWGAFGPGRASSAIKAAAIEAPQARETCIHHPQGCPPDCLCPKLQHDPGEEETGNLSEPTLVRCTALGDPISPPTPGPFLLARPIAFHLPESAQPLPA